jgi:hypothetical protein
MNTSNYEYKLLELLYSSSYNPLSKKPINNITNLVTKSIKSSSLDPNAKKCLLPHNPQTPRIYGKPKIHKKYTPLRPIVSAIGAPTHALSSFISDKLESFIGNSPSFIKDSINFIQKTRNIHLHEQDIMVSFDVVSLFTKIPIPKAIDLISKLLAYQTKILWL